MMSSRMPITRCMLPQALVTSVANGPPIRMASCILRLATSTKLSTLSLSTLTWSQASSFLCPWPAIVTKDGREEMDGHEVAGTGSF